MIVVFGLTLLAGAAFGSVGLGAGFITLAALATIAVVWDMVTGRVR